MVAAYSGGTIPANGIDADRVVADLEEFNDRILDILTDGQRFASWSSVALTDANLERIYIYRPMVPPTFDPQTNEILTEGFGGGPSLITQEELNAIRTRATLIMMLASMLTEDQPSGHSIVETILMRRNRWRKQ